MELISVSRSTFNKLALTMYVVIDVFVVVCLFVLWSGRYIPESDSWLIGGTGILGLVIVAVNTTMLKDTFPIEAAAVRKLFYEKAFAALVVVLGTTSLSLTLFRYALAELIGLAGGLGIALVLYRWLIPKALCFDGAKPHSMTVWQKIGLYFRSLEMLPIIVFGIPLALWAIALMRYGTTSQQQPDMHLWQYIIVQMWFFSTLLLIRSRFHFALDYFAAWYKKRE